MQSKTRGSHRATLHNNSLTACLRLHARSLNLRTRTSSSGLQSRSGQGAIQFSSNFLPRCLTSQVQVPEELLKENEVMQLMMECL